MSRQKNILATIGLVLSVSLITSALSVMMISNYDIRLQFRLLNAVCGEVLEQEPETESIISAALKEYTSKNADSAAKDNVLSVLGYQVSDFSNLTYRKQVLFVTAGGLIGFLLLMITLFYRNQRECMRIRALAEYLEQANIGKAAILSSTGEDDFSKLEDEIYKTVTYLYQTKETAVQVKISLRKIYPILHIK